jgi:hypothetical protein
LGWLKGQRSQAHVGYAIRVLRLVEIKFSVGCRKTDMKI